MEHESKGLFGRIEFEWELRALLTLPAKHDPKFGALEWRVRFGIARRKCTRQKPQSGHWGERVLDTSLIHFGLRFESVRHARELLDTERFPAGRQVDLCAFCTRIVTRGKLRSALTTSCEASSVAVERHR